MQTGTLDLTEHLVQVQKELDSLKLELSKAKSQIAQADEAITGVPTVDAANPCALTLADASVMSQQRQSSSSCIRVVDQRHAAPPSPS